MQPIGQPQGPLMGEAPKNEMQELTQRVQNLFILFTQEVVNESSVAHIHESRPGWKEELLGSYRAGDLVGCATLLGEAIDDCATAARELQQRHNEPAHQAFLEALSNIGQDEKNMMFSTLSKDVQPSLARDIAATTISAGPAFLWSVERIVRYSIGTRALPLTSLATRLGVAAVNIPGIAYFTEAFGLINDALERNPWPAAVGGMAGLGTSLAMYGIAEALQHTPAAPIAPIVAALAPKAGLMVGSKAAGLIRVGQFIRQRRRLVPRREAREKISKLFTQVTEGRKRKLKPLEEPPPAKRRRVSEQMGTIIEGLNPSPEKDMLRARFTFPLEQAAAAIAQGPQPGAAEPMAVEKEAAQQALEKTTTHRKRKRGTPLYGRTTKRKKN